METWLHTLSLLERKQRKCISHNVTLPLKITGVVNLDATIVLTHGSASAGHRSSTEDGLAAVGD